MEYPFLSAMQRGMQREEVERLGKGVLAILVTYVDTAFGVAVCFLLGNFGEQREM